MDNIVTGNMVIDGVLERIRTSLNVNTESRYGELSDEDRERAEELI